MWGKKAYIKKWIRSISKQRPELGNFSVCPFAKKSHIHIKECSVNDIILITGYDVVIFIVEDSLTLNDINHWVKIYNKKYPEYIFLEDAAKKDTYINGVQTNNGRYNLILCQNRKKLTSFREKLLNTDYYKYWSDEYLREILQEDYKLLKK